MMQNFKKLALAGAMAVAGAMGANAAVISVENAPTSWATAGNGANSTTLQVGASWMTGKDPSIVSGSVNAEYKSPFDPANANAGGTVVPNWDQIQYFTVGSPNLAPSPAVLTFSSLRSTFEMLWGSIDLYNALYFFNGQSTVATISGQDILDAGGTPSANGAAFVSISGMGMFDTVAFVSDFGRTPGDDAAAFEFSNVAAVPLPAGGLLLLTGLGGMALLRRRTKA